MIADFIIANPEKIIHTTISRVAKYLGIADATVFRFCNEKSCQDHCHHALAISPLSGGVNIPLFTVSQETDYRGEALISRISQLSIVDGLYVKELSKALL
ncbi:hypothetical protein [Bacillus sp. NTK074B]|uniref:hypothetical protein n=1 Tax=Bacillus sp. NTK074B TaxID=2802174 RepID=UPI0027B88DE2